MSFWVRRRRTAQRLVALGVVAFVSLRLFACMSVGPKASSAQIAALLRESTADQAAADRDQPVLSYLRAPRPGSQRVIYIHGTPGNASGWADFLVDPVNNLDSIAVDRLGFGESRQAGGVPSFEKQAAAIAPLLVKEGGHYPILVGHSLGGPIAAWLAADFPDKVAGLVIVAGSLDPDLERPGIMQRIATTALVRAILPTALDHSMGELDEAKSETSALADRLSSIVCPVVIVHGTLDELVPYENVEYMQRMILNASSMTTLTLDGSGHFVPWEKPESIREAIRKIVESQGP